MEVMMPRGRPPKPTALHLLQGTFRRDRHGKRRDAPWPVKRCAELTPAQAKLLKEMPRHLEGEARQHYVDLVTEGHWFEPVDRALLTSYVTAVSIHNEASRELSRCLQDPAFAVPGSDTNKAGDAYSRIVQRQSQLIFRLSDELLLNPVARARHGVEVRSPSAPDNSPWAQFGVFDRDDPSPSA